MNQLLGILLFAYLSNRASDHEHILDVVYDIWLNRTLTPLKLEATWFLRALLVGSATSVGKRKQCLMVGGREGLKVQRAIERRQESRKLGDRFSITSTYAYRLRNDQTCRPRAHRWLEWADGLLFGLGLHGP